MVVMDAWDLSLKAMTGGYPLLRHSLSYICAIHHWNKYTARVWSLAGIFHHYAGGQFHCYWVKWVSYINDMDLQGKCATYSGRILYVTRKGHHRWGIYLILLKKSRELHANSKLYYFDNLLVSKRWLDNFIMCIVFCEKIGKFYFLCYLLGFYIQLWGPNTVVPHRWTKIWCLVTGN